MRKAMAIQEHATLTLEGRYHDVLRDAAGDVVWDRGWHKNAIVVTCRHLLAGFLKGDPPVLGLGGLLVGAGLEAWDLSAPPQPLPTNTALVDPNPFKLPKGPDLKIDFLDGGMVVPFPTNRLQIAAKLGPNLPSWPDGNHTTSSLREFGLVGTLNGADVLLNYVTHPVITKDPASTLERTIWLVF
jgi:hypothetical protein